MENSEDIKRFFPKTDNWKNLQITEEGTYSITYPIHTKLITDKIVKKYKKDPKKLVITDASSCVGGDAIKFAQTFLKVNCVEYNSEHMKMLKNNLKVYNLENVEFFEGSYEYFCDKLKQDIIYCDPPWGGKDYMKSNKVRLKYGESHVEDLILKAQFKLAVLKLPKNYDKEFLQEKLKGVIIENIYKSDRKTVLFLLCFYHNI